MDWDGVTSVAWVVTSASLLLAALLTYWRLNGFRGFSLSDYMRYGEAALLLSRQLRDASWHLGLPILAVLCVHIWTWAGSDRARRRYRGPARNSRWLLIPIAVTAGILVVVCVVYRKELRPRPHPHFDTSVMSSGASTSPTSQANRD